METYNLSAFKTLSYFQRVSILNSVALSLKFMRERFLKKKMTYSEIQEYKARQAQYQEMKTIHSYGVSLFDAEEEEPF